LVVSQVIKLQVQRISNTCGNQALEHHTGFIGGLTSNKTTGTAHFQHLWQSSFGASYRLHWWSHK
jgi:hypothetical protein